MKPPYQPSLLRVIHAATAGAVGIGWLTGLVIYSRYDGRLFHLPWTYGGNLWELHHYAGNFLLPVAILLALYAVTLGNWRLHKPSNTVMLFVLALPLLSGKGMHKKWLIEGQFDHLIYKIHLLGWMLIAAGLIWHVASAFQRGGAPLVASMADLQVKEHDKPTDWPKQMVNWLGHHR